MKKTIAALAIVFVILIALQLWLLYGVDPFGISFSGKSAEAAFYTREGKFYIKDETGSFMIRGVQIDSFLPGHYSGDFAADESTYFSWMTQIAEMGANTVYVCNMMDPDFYNALYRYNTTRETPLYLIQGIAVPDYNLNNAGDAWEGFYDVLISDAKKAVNAVHGNRILTLARVSAVNNYTLDVSPWTIGYMIGSEWESYTLAYTDHKFDNPTSYSGEYFKTSSDATGTETMFAQVMDNVMRYETNRYGSQRPIGLSSSIISDPLTYNEDVRIQLGKCVRLNANHIQPGEKNLAGSFAGYYIRDEIEDFMICIDDTDRQEYGDALEQTDVEKIYGGYVDFLVKLHKDIPVVAYYGYSSARGTDEPNGAMNEEQQGHALVERYQKYTESGCQGTVISSWQDNWCLTSWNTLFATDEQTKKNWLDVQTKANLFGLLAFDPGKERSVCYVDGDMEEWTAKDVFFTNESFSLSMKYDEAYLYLLVRGDLYDEPLYLPIDVTPKSGSNYDGEESARCERFADFRLVLDGSRGAEMLVQKRYDSAYMAWEKRISGVNAIYNPPEVSCDVFGPIRHVLKKVIDPNAGLIDMDFDEREIFNRYDITETGKFVYGNGNPGSEDYDSLADYCYGDGFVEIRIPWQLLNFSNPSEMKIHDDYYLHYGVEEIRIKEIYVGVSTQSSLAVIPMARVALKGWNDNVEYHERLKSSYYIVQSAWRGETK